MAMMMIAVAYLLMAIGIGLTIREYRKTGTIYGRDAKYAWIFPALYVVSLLWLLSR